MILKKRKSHTVFFRERAKTQLKQFGDLKLEHGTHGQILA